MDGTTVGASVSESPILYLWNMMTKWFVEYLKCAVFWRITAYCIYSPIIAFQFWHNESIDIHTHDRDNTPYPIIFASIQNGPHRWNVWTTWCWCANPVRLRSRRAALCCRPAVPFVAYPSIRLWTTYSVSFPNSTYHHPKLWSSDIKNTYITMTLLP